MIRPNPETHARRIDARRFRKRLILFVAVAFGTVAILYFLGSRRPTTVPAVVMRLVSYTESGSLIAIMELTNTGPAQIGYHECLERPLYWGRALTTTGWVSLTNSLEASYFLVIKPGSNSHFYIDLPPHTIRWQAGFRVHAPSLRERVAWRVQHSEDDWWEYCWGRFSPGRILPIFAWSDKWLRFVPHAPGDEYKLETGVVEVDLTVGTNGYSSKNVIITNTQTRL